MSYSSTDRRSFLQQTALAAGSFAFAGLSSRRSKAAEAASDRIRVGCIGVGGRGTYVGNIACGIGEKVACADVDRTHAEAFAAGGPCAVYGDYREILDRQDIDLVTVGTPDHWHAKILIDAVKSGKDVYCEKPMTLTIDEGKKICEAVRRTGRIVQVGTQQRSSGQFLMAVAMAQSGRLGKVLKARCSIGGGVTGGPFATATPPSHLNWNAWLGQSPLVDYTPERCHGSFRGWLEYAGGIITDWGAHHVDIAQWALGCENTGPIECEGQGVYPVIPENFDMVEFFAGRAKLPNSFNTVTTFEVTHRFANGSTLTVAPGPDNGVLIEGEKGRIFVNRGRLNGKPVEALTDDDRQELATAIGRLYRGKPIDPFEVATDDTYTGYDRASANQVQNLIDCIRDRGTPVSDVFTHHRAVSTCHLTNITMLLRRKLQWNPDKEDFIGDPQASALVARPQRSPFEVA
ncbi:MAG: Gfo/Idh/MocA family oxidoreductase [Pirellulales bacterium]